MKRLFRKNRRSMGSKLFSRLKRSQSVPAKPSLVAETLEHRLLLTTLTLPADSNVLQFRYADPQATEAGADDVSDWIELQIGTLSGAVPGQDVVVEILDFQGGDIGGVLTVDGVEIGELGGGAAGGSIIDEVPNNPDATGWLGSSINCLASDNNGHTYGVDGAGRVLEINTTTGQVSNLIATINIPGFIWDHYDAMEYLNGRLYVVVREDIPDNPVYFADQSYLIEVTLPSVSPPIPASVAFAGRNGLGNPSQSESRIHRQIYVDDAFNDEPNIRTIVSSDASEVVARVPAGTDVSFLGYDYRGENSAFIALWLQEATAGPGRWVQTGTILQVADDVIIEGLAYDNRDRLFGLNGSDNQLVYIPDLSPDDPKAELFIEVVGYGDRPAPQDDVEILLTGMTFDSLNNIGYATDSTSQTLYTINIGRLREVESDDGEVSLIPRGLADIFQMYIASSTPDVYITLTYYTVDDSGIVYDPVGGESTFLFVDEDKSDVKTPDTAGGATIGTSGIYDGDNIIWSAGYIVNDDKVFMGAGTFFFSDLVALTEDGVFTQEHGAWPGGQPLRPGITLAKDLLDADGDGVTNEPQSIGKIQIGGEVFGDVILEGSIDTFYCGYLGTNRFTVKGDLNTLVVNTQSGGIADSANEWVPVCPSDFGGDGVYPTMEIWGNLGSFYANTSDATNWGQPITVLGRTDVPRFPGAIDLSVSNPADGTANDVYVRTVREIERKLVDGEEHVSFFPKGGFDLGDGSWVLTNDSPYLAQFLGAADGHISVLGECEVLELDYGDSEDFYSFGVLAGQTISLELFDTGGKTNLETGHPSNPASQVPVSRLHFNMMVYDPELNLIEVDQNADVVTGAMLPTTFVAEQAGIYTVAVHLVAGNYRLDIEGTSPMTLGGGNIIGDMRRPGEHASDAYPPPNITVSRGNMGALSVGGILRASEIIVNEGTLAAVRGAANTMPTGDLNVGPNKIGDNAPRHLHGEEIAAADPAPEIGFGIEISGTDTGGVVVGYGGIPIIRTGGTIGMISSDVRAGVHIFSGGDIQAVRIGGNIGAPAPEDIEGVESDPIQDFAGLIVADGKIGEITIAGHYGPIMYEGDTGWYVSGGIFANADGVGAPGTIDSIIINGELGRTPDAPINNALIVEIPVSTGRNKTGGAGGGNVRFVDIREAIFIYVGQYHETIGIGPYSFMPGQSVEIDDDSGSRVRISPGHTGEDVEDYLFGAAPPPGFNLPRQGDGGVLTIRLLPIRDQIFEEWQGDIDRGIVGYAIAQIDSTDGVRVTSERGGVDIGVITAEGRVDDAVIISGLFPINVLQISVTAPVETTTPSDTDDTATLPDTGIHRIINKTLGDVVAIRIGAPAVTAPVHYTGITELDPPTVELIQVKGNLGYTRSFTGQMIQSTLLSLVSEIDGYNLHDPTVAADPGGTQRVGLICAEDIVIDQILVGGSLYDVDVRGSVNRIVVNNDNGRGVNQFDGIAGPVTIYGDLGIIDLGDGVMSPGTARFARAGVFVFGQIDRAVISGAGRDIAGPVFAGLGISSVEVTQGARITGYTARYGWTGERVRGAFSIPPTIAVTNDFDDFMLAYISYPRGNSGPIDRIQVTGAGSEIREATIWASSIGAINVTGGAEGIFDSRIYARGSQVPGDGQINQITVGGQGMLNTVIAVHRDLKKLTLQPGGVLNDCEIRSSYHLGTITADTINRTDIDAFNKVDTVSVRQGIFDLVIEAGELGRLNSSESILGSGIFVGGAVGQISTKGDLISTIEITGPFGDLKNVKVGGDLGTPNGGAIIVDGRIGTITVGGDFLAELLVNWDPSPVSLANPQGPHKKYEGADYGRTAGPAIRSLSTGGNIVGLGDIGGDVRSITCGGDFGTVDEIFRVHGDLGTLTVGKGHDGGNLESDVTVDGDARTMFVKGNVNGAINVADNFGTLKLQGKSKLPGERADLNNSITVGGDFKALTIINGDIAEKNANGDDIAISVGGSGPKITIKGSDIAAPVFVNGSEGIDRADGSITATGMYVSTGDVDHIRLGGSVEAGGKVVIDGDLNELVVDDYIAGQIYVTGNIGIIRATNISPGAVIIAGGNIGSVVVEGTVGDGSYILAGYDPGLVLSHMADGSFGPKELTVDGMGADPLEHAHAASIKKVDIGTLWHAVIAAGVSPGSNAVFGDQNGTDTPAVGISKLGSVKIGTVVGDGLGGPFGVFTNTSIGSLKIGPNRLIPPHGPVILSSGFRALEIGAVSVDVNGAYIVTSGDPFQFEIDGKEVKVALKGPGTGKVKVGNDGTIETIKLEGTTLASTLMVQAGGAATIDVERLFTADDATVGTLILDNSTTGGTAMSMDIDGAMKRVLFGGVAAGSDIQIAGDVRTADWGFVRGTTTSTTTITVQGDVNQLTTRETTSAVIISADNIDKWVSQGDFGGRLQATEVAGHVGIAQVKGDLTGVLSANGDIDRVMVQGETSGAVRAGHDLGTFVSGSMFRGRATAGHDFTLAQINGDVEFSTLAAGLDIGADGELFNDNDNEVTSGRGDLENVSIRGNFIQSNIVAGVAPGADLQFGTADDRLQERDVEQVDAPQVVGVSFPDEYTINVKFRTVTQGRSSNIDSVVIGGQVEGSTSPQEHFAIIAAGEIGTIMANRQVFAGEANVLRSEVDTKGILESSIIANDIDTRAAALVAAFRVFTDGLDHQFGTADDIYLYGDDNASNDPNVFVTFDGNTNIASFHKKDGIAFNTGGTNYYCITIDDMVTNRQGTKLDGEYQGVNSKSQLYPSGDGTPGGDFTYYFAVGDLGDSGATAFKPFGEDIWPENRSWIYTSRLGDNLNYTDVQLMQDHDFIHLNNLTAGQILNVQATGRAAGQWFDAMQLRLWDLGAVTEIPNTYVVGANTRPDLEEDYGAVMDTLVPELDEISISSRYFEYDENLEPVGWSVSLGTNTHHWFNTLGYDDEQELFVFINTFSQGSTHNTAPVLIPNPAIPDTFIPLTLEVLSDTYHDNFGPTTTITSVKAMDFGQPTPGLDSEDLWLVVTAQTGTDAPRDSLLLIEDILDPASMMVLSPLSLANAGFGNITSLAYSKAMVPTLGTAGRLYGVDEATQTLVVIDDRVVKPDPAGSDDLINNTLYGHAIAVGDEVGNLQAADRSTYRITGIDFDRQGRLLGVEDNSDVLVEIYTDQRLVDNSAPLEFVRPLTPGDIYTGFSYCIRESNGVPDDSGFVIRADGGSITGTIDVVINGDTAHPVTHTFGESTGPIDGLVNSISSDENRVDGYFIFDIAYDKNAGDITLNLADIQWATAYGQVQSVKLDDPLFASVTTFDEHSVTLLINSNLGDGTLRMYVGASAELLEVSGNPNAAFESEIIATADNTLSTIIPQDENDNHDYLLEIYAVTNYSAPKPLTYDLKVMLFDDGNSDFGATVTPDGFDYAGSDYILFPDDAPVNLAPDATGASSWKEYNHAFYPITFTGDGLTPGTADSMIIDAALGCYEDVDVYTLRLTEGQRVTLDLDAETLFGRDSANLTVGLYNADLETVSTVSLFGPGTTEFLAPSQAADAYLSAQAIHQMPNHAGLNDPIIDPMTLDVGLGQLTGTYYVVVSGNSLPLMEKTSYRLTVTTTNSQPINTPSSQLVYLAFDGEIASYLDDPDYYPALPGGISLHNLVNRPAFDATDFNLPNQGNYIKQQVKERIEAIYRNAGLSEDEITFTLDKPLANLGQIYTTVIFGGRLSDGLLGIARTVDRDNSQRQDFALSLTEEIGRVYLRSMSDDPAVRLTQVINLIANNGAHELGHTLGLEHATEVTDDVPHNLMNYNSTAVRMGQEELMSRNKYWYQPIGFTNEVDILLRNIGSGSALGY